MAEQRATKDALHATLDQLVRDTVALAHRDELDKVERFVSHAKTLHMCIEQMQGAPALRREYVELPLNSADPDSYVTNREPYNRPIRVKEVLYVGRHRGTDHSAPGLGLPEYDPVVHDVVLGQPHFDLDKLPRHDPTPPPSVVLLRQEEA